jgi:hypothetical protein
MFRRSFKRLAYRVGQIALNRRIELDEHTLVRPVSLVAINTIIGQFNLSREQIAIIEIIKIETVGKSFAVLVVNFGNLKAAYACGSMRATWNIPGLSGSKFSCEYPMPNELPINTHSSMSMGMWSRPVASNRATSNFATSSDWPHRIGARAIQPATNKVVLCIKRTCCREASV